MGSAATPRTSWMNWARYQAICGSDVDRDDFVEFDVVLEVVKLPDGGSALGGGEAGVAQFGGEFGDLLIGVHGSDSPRLTVSWIEDIPAGIRRTERVKAAQRRHRRATGEPKFSGARHVIGRRPVGGAPVNFGGTVAP